MATLPEFEVRVDEEQGVKLQQMLDLLLASGYFRARIKTLSSFDKIVGGIVWCISMCYYDIDVDLLFQEDSSIGSKIALTEKIVVALKLMKCPQAVEPHQIQGLDFKHIFPVVQWLVKKSIETQKDREKKTRNYSIVEFNKYHHLPDNLSKHDQRKSIMNTISYIEDIYKAQRKYKQVELNLNNNEERKIQLTLLEYGRKFTVSDEISQDKSKTPIPKTDNLHEDLQGMSETGINGKNISMKSVANILKMNSSQLKKTVTSINTQLSELHSENDMPQIQINSSTNLKNQIEIKRKNIEELDILYNKLVEELKIENESLTQIELKNKQLEEELSEINCLEGNEENKMKLSQIQMLISENEKMKKEELKFKENCKKEKEDLNLKIENLKMKTESNLTGKEEMDVELQKKYEENFEKLKKIRLLMSKKNREIAKMQRMIDDMPSRAELQQYQARFLELYDQILLRHRETKQFYNLYNTSEDTRLYLNKEINLLNSVGDTFQQAMSSSAQKTEFLKQIETIVEGVTKNKEKIEKRLLEEKLKHDQLSEKLSLLNEQKRIYYKIIKDFQEECHKNEILFSQTQE